MSFLLLQKHQQLANSILLAIENRKLQVDDVLPSIDELSSALEVSGYSGERL
jgi:DNA-binding GntR family transcriptional regulator